MSDDDEALPRILRLPLLIRREEVLHFLGYPEGRTPPRRVAARIDEALTEARGLAAGKGAYKHLPVEEATAFGLEPIAASGLVIGLVTVGGAIERRVADHLESGDATAALLLDAAGSAAAEEAADHLCAVVASSNPDDRTNAPTMTNSPTGHRADQAPPGAGTAADGTPPGADPADAVPVSCRISPGYGAWPLEAQSALLDRLPHARLGVSLLPSMLMVPRKSISFAMWLGADAQPIAGLSGCARCRLPNCRYRRRTI